MAIRKTAPGPSLPLSNVVKRQRGRLIILNRAGVQIAQAWPRPRKRKQTPAELEQQNEFKRMVQMMKDVPSDQVVAAREIAEGSKYIWRDILSLLGTGQLVKLDNYGAIVSQYNLDVLGDQPGMIVIRTTTEWVALPVGLADQILTIISGLPAWADNPAITALTGDVTAPAGGGSTAATLAASGVSAGSYTAADITVDAKGRITAASSHSFPGSIVGAGGIITLYSATSSVGNATGSGQQTLQTYTMPANTLTTAGQRIRIKAAGTLAAASTTRTIGVHFGSTFVSAFHTNAGYTTWEINAEIVVYGTTSQVASIMRQFGGGSNVVQGFLTNNTPSENITAQIVIDITGQTARGTANDVVCNYFAVDLIG